MNPFMAWGKQLIIDLGVVTADLLDERVTEIKELIMSATSDLLDAVAEGLNGELSDAVVALMQENADQATKIAGLEGSDVVESEAAGRVKTAFDNLASKLTDEPSAPDVPPLPDVPVPDAPSDDDSGSSSDPVTDDGSQSV